jgi:hypothetical protein
MSSTSFAPSNTFAGKTSQQTKMTDLTGPADLFGLITGIKVFWSNYIVGFEFLFGGKSGGSVKGTHSQNIWEEEFLVKQGDYIVSAFGRSSNVITCFGIRTSKGLTKVWGNPCEGDPWTFGLNGSYIKAFTFGTEEYLTYATPVYEDEAFVTAQRMVLSPSQKFTTMLGSPDKNCENFDDFDWIKDKFNFSVGEIKLWHDGNYVYGVQFYYLLDGTKKTPGKHCADGNLKTETLQLVEDEHITKILVRSGQWIDHITFITDKGRKISAGGHGGAAHLIVAPPGHQFISVSGSHSNVLRQILCNFDEIF